MSKNAAAKKSDTHITADDIVISVDESPEIGFPPAGDVTRFQPLRGIARFYYAHPFRFLRRGGLRKFFSGFTGLLILINYEKQK